MMRCAPRLVDTDFHSVNMLIPASYLNEALNKPISNVVGRNEQIHSKTQAHIITAMVSQKKSTGRPP